MERHARRWLQGFVVPCVVVGVLVAAWSGETFDDAAGVGVWAGLLAGLLCWCLLLVVAAPSERVEAPDGSVTRGRPVPMVAVAVLVAALAVVCGGAGVYVGFVHSDRAGTVMVYSAMAGVVLAGVAVVSLLAGPRGRRISLALNSVAAALVVVGGGSMVLLVSTADQRYTTAVESFPAAGSPTAIAAGPLVGLEDDVDSDSGVARRWPDSGLDCEAFVRRFEDWAGSQGRRADGFSGCVRESQSAWSVRRARLQPDGTLDVAMWPRLVDVDWLF